MRNDKIVPGVTLILIGAAFLLHNYGYISFHWRNMMFLWPLLIVIGGINLIFAHNRSTGVTLLKLAVIVLAFGLLLFGNFSNRTIFFPHYQYNTDDNNDDSGTQDKIVKIEGTSEFNQPYTADAKVARLNINGGGTIYTLTDTTNQLFNAVTKEYFGKYNFEQRKDDSVYVLDFNMKNSHNTHFGWNNDKKTNSATFKLNVNPEWEINVETGATKLNFDLSKFKVRLLKLSGGAASFDVKLGQPLAATNVNVSTGVSEVNISIPATAACQIKTESGLSSSNFEGFIKRADNSYETAGFSTAKNKIYIRMTGGISDFKVKRY